MKVYSQEIIISTKPRKNSWIEYKEKIPNEGQDCWVCQYDDNVSRGNYINCHEIFGSGFGSDEEFIKEKYIKYWMPYYTPTPPIE